MSQKGTRSWLWIGNLTTKGRKGREKGSRRDFHSHGGRGSERKGKRVKVKDRTTDSDREERGEKESVGSCSSLSCKRWPGCAGDDIAWTGGTKPVESGRTEVLV